MEKSAQLSIEKLLSILKKYLVWIILAAVVAGCGAAVCAELLIEDAYTCRMQCMIGEDVVMTGTEWNYLDMFANRSVGKLKTKEVIAKVVEEAQITVNGELAVDQMKAATSFSVDAETGTYTISVTTTNPEASYKMIASFYKLLPEIIEEKGLYDATVIEKSEEAPTSPSNGSRAMKYGLLGAVAGAVILYAIFVIRAMIDVTIRTESDVKEYIDLPILGQIPFYSGSIEDGNQLINKLKYARK